MKPLGLAEAVELLREYHGPPVPPLSSDPFELVLLENVAYLSNAARRREAFELLRSSVGTTPEAISKAPRSALEKVTSRGILPATFADKLRECARIALDDSAGGLAAAIGQPLPAARKALQKFPGIGEPGAEKILLFSGRQAVLAPESNGLRVLVRLGLVPERRAYAQMHAAARPLAQQLGNDLARLRDAHLLLQRHGQVLCKRNGPRCEVCPLASRCAHAAREGRAS